MAVTCGLRGFGHDFGGKGEARERKEVRSREGCGDAVWSVDTGNVRNVLATVPVVK